RKRIPHISGSGRIGNRGRRVEDRFVIPEAQGAKITAPLRRSRHVALARASVANSRTLVSREEERPVVNNRSSNRSAKKVIAQRRLLLACEIRKEVGCIQIVVAEKLLERSMELIGTGLCSGVDLYAKPPELRGVGIHLDLE